MAALTEAHAVRSFASVNDAEYLPAFDARSEPEDSLLRASPEAVEAWMRSTGEALYV